MQENRKSQPQETRTETKAYHFSVYMYICHQQQGVSAPILSTLFTWWLFSVETTLRVGSSDVALLCPGLQIILI